MKKCWFALCLALSLTLLAGCKAPAGGGETPRPGGQAAPTVETPTGGDVQGGDGSAQPAAAIMTCRIIDGAETGKLVLAGGRGSADVYLLTVGELPVTGADALEDGMMVEIGYGGTVMETYPAQLGAVVSIKVLDEEKSDLAGLYLQVFEDLWAVDPGLNDGITQLGVDLTKLKGLSDSEKSALAYVFGMDHGIMPVLGTWAELRDQGYFASAGGEGLYQWEDGCLFSVEGDTDSFHAQKWRSPLGAYVFYECSAKEEEGTWTYEAGSEMIS
ncbi:MAG: hypothetical protein EOM52_05035 [Clostridia bacterium]|nr:hypothetical protein [Clostridia bacterium]